MAAAASRGGMLPEQVWDGPAIPSRRLQPGRATGSAMPLAWAHAEFVKLMRSRDLGRPFDRPQATWERYKGAAPSARIAFWWRHARIRQFATGSRVVVALPRPGTVRWGIDGWQAVAETLAEDTGLGFYAAALDTSRLSSGQQVNFTIRWASGYWIGADFNLRVSAR